MCIFVQRRKRPAQYRPTVASIPTVVYCMQWAYGVIVLWTECGFYVDRLGKFRDKEPALDADRQTAMSHLVQRFLITAFSIILRVAPLVIFSLKDVPQYSKLASPRVNKLWRIRSRIDRVKKNAASVDSHSILRSRSIWLAPENKKFSPTNSITYDRRNIGLARGRNLSDVCHAQLRCCSGWQCKHHYIGPC